MEILILSLIVLLAVVIIIASGLKIVPQGMTMIIERLGRYHKTLQSGLNFILPVFDKPRTISWDLPSDGKRKTVWIDLREQVYDYPKQSVITKDNVTISIDALLYFQIMDPMKAVYEVANLTKAIEMLTQTTLRNVVGKLTLDECLTSRDEINTELCRILDEATDKWGVKVNRVEIKDIEVPESIRVQMEKQMTAEREKRAVVAASEGRKLEQINLATGAREAAIAQSEGEKQAEINKAEGQAAATVALANATAEALRRIAAATQEAGGMTAVNLQVAEKYVAAFSELAKTSNTLVVPGNMGDLAGMIASAMKIIDGAKAGGAEALPKPKA